MITATTSIRVRFAETDAMGVVYHANYLPWCEVARLELIESIGLNYRNINEQGYHLPVLEEYLHYKFPAKYDDIVEIKATIKERPAVRVKMEYEMRANGRVLVAGYTVHAFVDSRGMPVKPPKEIAKKLLDTYDADAGAEKK